MYDEFRIPGTEFVEGEMLLATFVYCSRAADGVDDPEVARIVEFAQSHNRARGITGMLVYESGVFFQWVEGPVAQVQRLMTSLYADARHYDVVALDHSEERRERLYPDWEMEQVGADDLHAVLQDALATAEDQSIVAALNRILAQLASGPWVSLRQT
ncbi:BLUF domain-containing protein [Sphingomonas humi]|uniref:BLUF domain-containing protein n=1 Tax=Sphingomonas humi TaxID=335630 RepID=A0ABP7S491_9SPHN